MLKTKGAKIASTFLVLACSVAFPARADSNAAANEPNAVEDKTIFVAIDDQSTKSLGSMPVSRTVYLRALQKAKQAGAKGLIIKFFFNRETPDDKALGSAMASLPVAVQISSAQGMPSTDALARLDRYVRHDWQIDQIKEPLSAKNFMGPNPSLLSNAYAIGTVDARISPNHDRIESFARYGDKVVPSLQIVTAEMARGTRGSLMAASFTLGTKKYALDQQGRLSCSYLFVGRPRIVSIDNLLEGKLANSELKDKVIILGYMRSDSPKIRVSDSREIPVHEYFYRQVLCLLNSSK